MLKWGRYLFVANLCVLAGLSAGCAKSKVAVKEMESEKVEVLASVGNREITNLDIKQAVSNLPENYRTLASSYEGKRQILDNLIKKNLLIQEAESRGYAKEKDIQNQIKESQARAAERIRQQIAELQKSLTRLDQHVYENVLLMELNSRLEQDAARKAGIRPEDIQAYYQNYIPKLKRLNPAAKAPSFESVSDKIRAILVEDRLLEELKSKNKIIVNDERLRRLFSTAGEKTAAIPAGQGQTLTGQSQTEVKADPKEAGNEQ